MIDQLAARLKDVEELTNELHTVKEHRFSYNKLYVSAHAELQELDLRRSELCGVLAEGSKDMIGKHELIDAAYRNIKTKTDNQLIQSMILRMTDERVNNVIEMARGITNIYGEDASGQKECSSFDHTIGNAAVGRMHGAEGDFEVEELKRLNGILDDIEQDLESKSKTLIDVVVNLDSDLSGLKQALMEFGVDSA